MTFTIKATKAYLDRVALVAFCKKTKSPVKYFLIQGVILIHFAIFARNRIRDSRWVKEQKA